LRGPCPLPTHGSERSRQSFSVDTAKNVWACHSASCCEARQGRMGGNVLDLVAWLERCSIRDAALHLQDEWCGWRIGMKVCEQQLASKGSLGSGCPDRLPPLTFSLRLRWHPYLEQRAVHPSTAAWFGIGYYAGSGFLRHRVVFPIHDSEGQLVAYAGRSIDGSEPRYLFPPNFRKSQVVFNLHRRGGDCEVGDCGGGILRLPPSTSSGLPQRSGFDGSQPLGGAGAVTAGALSTARPDARWRRGRATGQPAAGGAVVGKSLADLGGGAKRWATRPTVERGNRMDSVRGERRSWSMR